MLRLNWGRMPGAAVICLLLTGATHAQSPGFTDSVQAGGASMLPALAIRATSAPLNENRILGVIPDYQTVRDANTPVAPLTPKQKWSLALRETVDPFNIASAALASGFSQIG